MNRFRTIRLLVTPSFLSAITCIVAGLWIIVTVSWSYIAEYHLFYEYLFGRYSLATILLTAPDSFSAIRRVVFTNSVAQFVVVFVAGTVAGLITFATLELTEMLARRTIRLAHILHEQNSEARTELRAILGKLVLRTITLLAWGVYWILFLQLVVPFSAVTAQSGVELLAQSNNDGWGYLAAISLFMVLSLHVHIIFMRLVTFRVRLFGGRYIE